MKFMVDYFNEIYRKIHEYEDAEGGYAYHDYNHVNNVANYCEKILKALKYDDNFIQEAKIAAILHDTGCINGKENNAYEVMNLPRNI